MLHPYEIAKSQELTLLRRSCSTCNAFTPAEGKQVSSCANRVPVVRYLLASEKKQKLSLEPGPDDWCSFHHTQEEDWQKDAAMDSFWQRLVYTKIQSAQIYPSA
ncbi:hypothetical protein [Polaromonas glacialis]|uniref:hypothetical protein n=1 Tax=Polaromonas glacialis TaxID=866564 RepID=UPI0012EB47C4|nr:hypothetical protein [Polaromonas glacialis]